LAGCLITGALAPAAASAAAPGGGATAPLADARRPPVAEVGHTQRPVKRRSSAAMRRASRSAYGNLDRSQAVELAQDHFPELRQRAYRSLELRPGERVAQWLGDRAARIEQGAGRPDLFLESQLPLRTADAEPVDLALRTEGDSFSPLSPLVDVNIDADANDGLHLPDIDVGVAPVGTENVTGVARQDKAFFAEATADTDLVVTPLPQGVDLGAQLRSPASPETVRWRLDLPAGAQLRESSDGGAEIIGADGALAKITAPIAWDADDRAVITRLRVEGSELVVAVEHRDADVRYPILLDPTILEDNGFWSSTTGIDLTGWMFTNPSSRFNYFYGSAYLGNGLYIFNRGTRPFNASDYANWYFNAPGTSRIVRADFGYVKHEPQTTGTWPAPYNDDRIYQGVWSYTLNRYENGTWCEPAAAGGACGRSPFSTYGALNYNSKSHTNLEGTPGNAAIFGTSVYYTGNHTDFTSFLGSAAIYIEDDVAPVLSEDNGLNESWSAFRSFQVRATDSGLGVKSLVLDSPAVPNWTGRYAFNANCTGDRTSRCPQSAFAFSDSSRLPEGVVPVRLTATDAVGNASTRTWRLRIDRSAPAIDVPVERAEIGRENSEYTAAVTARDGDELNQRSGVRTIDFALLDEDGDTELLSDPDPEPQSCDASCPKTRSWTFPVDTLPDGRYMIRAVATDQTGMQATETWPLDVRRGVPPRAQ
jgi:hypothetical protein